MDGKEEIKHSKRGAKTKAKQRCADCSLMFAYECDYLRHIKVHTAEKPYICNVCQKQFSRQSNLNIHMLIHSPTQFHMCSICGAKFRHISSCRRHMKTHIETMIYVYDESGQQLSQHTFLCHKNALNVWTKNEKNNATVVLEYNGDMEMKNSEPENLSRKIDSTKSSTSLTSQDADELPYSEVVETCMQKNVSEADDTRAISCDKPAEVLPFVVANGAYSDGANCNSRENTKGDTSSKFDDISNKPSINTDVGFSNSFETEHQKKQNHKADLFCGRCQKHFLRKNDFDRHVWTHTGEKPFMCELCSRTFARLSNLKVHMLTHNPEKRFSCNLCALKFVHSNSFRRHLRIHAGEKLYLCEKCSQQFHTCNRLKNHDCFPRREAANRKSTFTKV